MNPFRLKRLRSRAACCVMAATLLAATSAVAGEHDRSVLVVTSTNDPASNAVVVFKLETGATSSLSYLDRLPTGGGCSRSASEKPVPTENCVPSAISTSRAPSRPL